MAEELLRLRILNEEDVFAVRQAGRQVAAAVRLDVQDQVRVATALSEVGRELFTHIGDVTVVFRLDRGHPPGLVMELESEPAGSHDRPRDGDAAAARLLDLVEETGTPAGRGVRLRKNLPHDIGAVDGPALDELRVRLGRLRPAPALEELRTQNAELIEALVDARRRREELQVLNAELEETNHGVVALYNELSTELEETNRGVVALYAELDEKSSQLREAAEARKRFWATVSHELRSPLNSIIGLVRLLTGPGGDPLTEEQEQQVGFIGGSAETLLMLVGELLDMAKAESGPLRPEHAPVDLVALAHHLRATMQPTGAVVLSTDVAPEVAELYTDETMLVRVLRNLLSNALKFTPEGEVRLDARLDERAGEVVITVSDTGIGIAEEDQRHVFEEFFQVPNALQVKARGTGLGLPYARRLAEALDGRLDLTSAPGEGTTVTVRLPRHHGTPEVGRLLIADDDQGFRELARRMLYGIAHEIDEAADGAEALETMTARRPDVIVLDMLMPRLDGNGLLQRMSEDETLGEVAVVVVTAAPGAAVRGHPVLPKHGLRREQLLEAVREAIRGRRA